ncbi:membrane protein [Mycobacterium phage Timothy]|nr:hypothetical protein SEA_MABEL_44 [Mycobacterium phage Mabel]UAW09302.1 membrane protein [Mycobacterium phage Timothy]
MTDTDALLREIDYTTRGPRQYGLGIAAHLQALTLLLLVEIYKLLKEARLDR